MTSLLGIIAGISAALAVVLASLFIGVCLVVAWIADLVWGRGRRGVHGRPGRAGAAPLHHR